MMDPWGLGLFFAPEDTTVTNTSGNYAVVDKKSCRSVRSYYDSIIDHSECVREYNLCRH